MGRLPLGSAVIAKSRMDWYFSRALALDFAVFRLAVFFADFFFAATTDPWSGPVGNIVPGGRFRSEFPG
jgi:hypothetical protein